MSGAIADKPARLVAPGEPVELAGPPPRFVSRGGEKLDAALEQFAIAVEGRTALDAGASTGGFTDCLLQRGASHVTAVDVGHGQLDLRLRTDPRVTVRERTNIRHLEPASAAPVDLVVADLSFVSLRTVAVDLVAFLHATGDLVVLIKPQFEAGRVEASRGKGVIRDPAVHRAAIEGVKAAFEAAGATMMEVMVSPLRGAEGNVEFLAHLRLASGMGVSPPPVIDLDAVVAGTP